MVTDTIGDTNSSQRLDSEGARVPSRTALRPICGSSYSAQEHSQQEDQGVSDEILRYINQILMEEDLEEDCVIQESLELRKAEKSFYDVIGTSYPSSPNRNFGVNHGTNALSGDSNLTSEVVESVPADQSSQAASIDGPAQAPDLCNGIQSASLFIKGVEEASKLIPSTRTLELFVSSSARGLPTSYTSSPNRNFGVNHGANVLSGDSNLTSEVVESVPADQSSQAVSIDGPTQAPDLCNGIQSASLFTKGVEEASKLIPSTRTLELFVSSSARGLPTSYTSSPNLNFGVNHGANVLSGDRNLISEVVGSVPAHQSSQAASIDGAPRVPDLCNVIQSASLFTKGVEEASKLIPSTRTLELFVSSSARGLPTSYKSSLNRNFGVNHGANVLSGDSNLTSEVVESVPADQSSQAASIDGAAQVPDLCNVIQSASLFIKESEEASKLIPSTRTLELFVSSSARELPKRHHNGNFSGLEEERSGKQAAIYLDTYVHSDMFDEILLNHARDQNKAIVDLRETLKRKSVKKMKQNVQSESKWSGGRRKENRKEVVDLRTLLINCAEAVTTNDHSRANEMLSQIRQNSSPSGDGSQRLAHYLADGLEARLAGIGSRVYNELVINSSSSVCYVKAYLMYLAACPFRKVSNLFSNKTILKLTRRATRIHIIEFGFLHGFQWPAFIQRLSERLGDPPKIRITGIDIPQPGFRPARRVEEAGRMLAHYAKKFRVPFEFNPIVKRWETIQLEDFKLDKDEMVIVNCIYQMKNLPDETMVADGSRNAILDIIRKINPAVFVQGVLNGAYNASFFLTRFREALFHFSSFYDMLETVMPGESEERKLIEREYLGREALNVMACEGWERIERPETYKQWQARTCRAGLVQLPLDPEIKDRATYRVKAYHKEFLIDQDGHWLRLGWKGRILCALSTWKPA